MRYFIACIKFFTIISILSSCSLIDGLKETGKTTKAMRKTTLNMYQDSRSGGASSSRNNALKAMMEKSEISSKLVDATKYYRGFEFQLWRNNDFDTAEMLSKLKDAAMPEFFRTVGEFLKDTTLTEVEAGSTEDYMMNLYALAITMHVASDDYVAITSSAGQPSHSMLDMIEEGLLVAKEVGRNPGILFSQPGYIRTVVEFEDTAVYLLRIRQNILAGMALAKLSDIRISWAARNLGLFGRLAQRSADWAKAVFGHGWEPRFATNNAVQIGEAARWLNESVRVRDFLKNELEVDPMADGTVIGYFEDMKILNEERISSLSDKEPGKSRAVQAFYQSIYRYLDLSQEDIVAKMEPTLDQMLASIADDPGVYEFPPQMTFSAGKVGTYFIPYTGVCYNSKNDTYTTLTAKEYCEELDPFANSESGDYCKTYSMRKLTRPANDTKIICEGSSEGCVDKVVDFRYERNVMIDIMRRIGGGSEGIDEVLFSRPYVVPECSNPL